MSYSILNCTLKMGELYGSVSSVSTKLLKTDKKVTEKESHGSINRLNAYGLAKYGGTGL